MSSNSTFVFPKPLAEKMARAPMKSQLEAQMLSTIGIMISTVLTAIYFLSYMSFMLWYKITFLITSVLIVILLGVSVVGSYQQYITYLDVLEMQALQTGKIDIVEASPKQIKRTRNIVAYSLMAIGAIFIAWGTVTSGIWEWILIAVGFAFVVWGLIIISKTEDYIKSKADNTSDEDNKRDERRRIVNNGKIR